MNKKIWLLLIIPTLLLLVTGCGKTNIDNKKVDNTKKIVLKDAGFGYKTTFSYDSKEKYSEVEEDKDSGRSTQITFDNEELDIQFEMYYTDMTSSSYKTTQNARSNQKYYKEYKFGDYEAYAYGEYSSGLYINVLLETDDKDMAKILFISIDRLDADQSIVVADVVADTKVQELLNSIKFEKEKSSSN